MHIFSNAPGRLAWVLADQRLRTDAPVLALLPFKGCLEIRSVALDQIKPSIINSYAILLFSVKASLSV